jgi:hypothetical protein
VRYIRGVEDCFRVLRLYPAIIALRTTGSIRRRGYSPKEDAVRTCACILSVEDRWIILVQLTMTQTKRAFCAVVSRQLIESIVPFVKIGIWRFVDIRGVTT